MALGTLRREYMEPYLGHPAQRPDILGLLGGLKGLEEEGFEDLRPHFGSTVGLRVVIGLAQNSMYLLRPGSSNKELLDFLLL